jgi:carotenoid cleavage dioxygenase-like enzyme
LLVILDDLRGADLSVVRVEPDVAKSAPLSQKIPALIQFDLELGEPLPIGFRKRRFLVQPVFLRNQLLNVVEDGLILGMILHRSLLPSERDGVV